METGLESLPDDHPLHEVWYACIDAGYDMNLNHPEAFAMHMLQCALELIGEGDGNGR